MSIPDLKAVPGAEGKLSNKYLNYKHANNTLIISVGLRKCGAGGVEWKGFRNQHVGSMLTARIHFISLSRLFSLQYVKPRLILDLESKNKVDIKKMGNGGTSSIGGANAATNPTNQNAAQAIVAEAKTNAAKSDKAGEEEFGGLKGLRGIAGKDADGCKQQ